MAKLGYVAFRPGSVAEPNAGHALFDAHGVPVRAEIQRELKETESAIITSVVSVRREDAAELGLSYARFRRLFTRAYKVPPAEYRIRRRIEKIQSLLTGSDLPLKEIADRFGYADVYTFARQFKQCTGITPGQFRKR